MKVSILSSILLASLLVIGCSQTATAPGDNQVDAGRPVANETLNEWIWGRYNIVISADRTEAEVLPVRNSSSHLNVTNFVEGPTCPNCLAISKPLLQPDGTIKLKVWLTHPFQGHPEYTGFDVRGILVFESTEVYFNHWSQMYDSKHNLLQDPPLYYYSNPANGGAALLNADGYTFYLNPALIFEDKPGIFNYHPGEHSYGEPDSTVNPYILFSDNSPRRMFKTYDFITRTFHIKPPEGPDEFEFGYVVSACWVPPLNVPVTDPALDFPMEANCEDPYQITLEQLQPIDLDSCGQVVFKATIRHRPGTLPRVGAIIVPTLSSSPEFNPNLEHILFVDSQDGTPSPYINHIDEETTEIYMLLCSKTIIGDGLTSGWHFAMFRTLAQYAEYWPPPTPSQISEPVGVKPVMVYVEV